MDSIYKDIVRLQQKVRDYLDQPKASVAVQLTRAIQQLEDAAQTRKNPRTLDDQSKQIIRLVESFDGDAVMDHHHQDDVINRLEDIQRKLRTL